MEDLELCVMLIQGLSGGSSNVGVFKQCVDLLSHFITLLGVPTFLVYSGGVWLETEAHFSLYIFMSCVPLCVPLAFISGQLSNT